MGAWKAKDERAKAMYELYQTGLSCRQVGEQFGCSGESVGALFKTRGYERRPSPKARSRKMWKAVVYQGQRYTPEKDGYLRLTTSVNGRRVSIFLHRVVWEAHHGPIAPDMQVSFKDSDRTNCEIWNLELLTRAQVQQLHSRGANGSTKGMARREYPAKSCFQCGQPMYPHLETRIPENIAAFIKRRFCGPACAGLWKKGKPKGTKLAAVNWRDQATFVEPAREIAIAKFALDPSVIRRPSPEVSALPPVEQVVDLADEPIEPFMPPAPMPLCPRCSRNDLPTGQALCYECRDEALNRLNTHRREDSMAGSGRPWR